MSRGFLRWVVPGVAAFLLVLVVRLPAAWFRSLLPASVSCAVIDGTLWSGSCAGMQLAVAPGRTAGLDKLSWSLRPGALLRARLAAQVQIVQGAGEASALMSLRPQGITVDALEGRLPVDRQLLPLLPAGWRADVAAQGLSFAVEGGNILRLGGVAQVHQLTDAENDNLGSYEITFGASGEPPFAGQLRDSGGPLAVAATVRVEARGAWQIDGRVTPRAAASAGLVRQVRMLGLPAADGSYPFSIAGE